MLLWACAPRYVKPVAEGDFVRQAMPRLEAFLQRVLPQTEFFGSRTGEIHLLGATLFEDGLYFETWDLLVEVGTEQHPLVLKLFPDPSAALRSEIAYRHARQFGWPIPTEHYRGTVEPYRSQTGLLMERVPGETLSAFLRHRYPDQAVDPAVMTTAMQSLGKLLGKLHTASAVPRTGDARSGKNEMARLIENCRDYDWCGPITMARFRAMAGEMDGPLMVFSHNDLYEDHVMLDDTGQATRLLGLHSARYADPALDVGTVLSHLLIIQKLTRYAELGVKNPTTAEMKQSAEAFLGAYREACLPCQADWPQMVRRVKGYTWLRLGNLLASLDGNPHAQEMVSRVFAEKVELFAEDPFAKLSVHLFGADESRL